MTPPFILTGGNIDPHVTRLRIQSVGVDAWELEENTDNWELEENSTAWIVEE